MEQHGSETYFVLGEGLLGESDGGRATAALALVAKAAAPAPPFRFSRMGPRGLNRQLGEPLRTKLGVKMTAGGGGTSRVPAGLHLPRPVPRPRPHLRPHEGHAGHRGLPRATCCRPARPALTSTRSTARARRTPESARFYAADGIHFKLGKTVAADGIPAKDGFDLPRGAGNTAAERRHAIIPDPRNDENLVVAQTHLALMRFHNRVADSLPASVPAAQRFAQARELVTLHYQWMVRTDYLPRICARPVVDDVFKHGRKAFEAGAAPTDVPTMPIEFSVAAFRLGHSMVRPAYNWNKIFDDGAGTLDLLFLFSGTSGTLGGEQGPAQHLDRRLPPALRLRRRRPARPRRPGSQLQPRDADRHQAREPAAQPAAGLLRRSGHPGGRPARQPRLPQPGAGAHGQAGHGAADGHVPARARASSSRRSRASSSATAAPGSTSTGSRRRRRARCSRTRRCGSTCCARRSSTAAG